MTKSEAMDGVNLAIIRHLWDGRKPYAEIAEELDLNTNTVRNRVTKMKESGVLEIMGLVEPRAIEGHYSAFVTFKVEYDKIEEALSQIGVMRGVVGAAALSGSFDIVAVIFFNDEYSPEHFLFEELIKVKGIKSVETQIVVKSVNWQLRYVL